MDHSDLSDSSGTYQRSLKLPSVSLYADNRQKIGTLVRTGKREESLVSEEKQKGSANKSAMIRFAY